MYTIQRKPLLKDSRFHEHNFRKKSTMNITDVKITNQIICDYKLSLSDLSTLNGKLDLAAYVLLCIIVVSANILLVYGMVKTKEFKTNTAK